LFFSYDFSLFFQFLYLIIFSFNEKSYEKNKNNIRKEIKIEKERKE